MFCTFKMTINGKLSFPPIFSIISVISNPKNGSIPNFLKIKVVPGKSTFTRVFNGQCAHSYLFVLEDDFVQNQYIVLRNWLYVDKIQALKDILYNLYSLPLGLARGESTFKKLTLIYLLKWF